MTHTWRLRKYLPERHGRKCRVLSRGRMGSIKVEFADGVQHITNRYAVRRIK
jgi:hypothetical protein